MSSGLIVIVVICLIWFIRLEIKTHNLKIGKHYKLYGENGYPISYLKSDGTLEFDIMSSNLMDYKTAAGIKRLYPELIMVNKQTGKEVAE